MVEDTQPSRKRVQGEPVDKKLAPRNVPPFSLKNGCLYGPKVAFYFLKMWKLAAGGPIRARPGRLALGLRGQTGLFLKNGGFGWAQVAFAFCPNRKLGVSYRRKPPVLE